MRDFPETSDEGNITSIFNTNSAKLIERLSPNVEMTEEKYAVEVNNIKMLLKIYIIKNIKF